MSEPRSEYVLPTRWVHAIFRAITFDEWVGTRDRRAVMWVKHLLRVGGYRVAIHKFVRADEEGCFHSHPAHAIRIVLSGGYIEELSNGTKRAVRPGHVGHIAPALEHRVAALLDGRSSWSLWLRGPSIAKIHIRGCG